MFNPALIDFVQTHASALDHLAVMPDRCWSDAGPGSARRFEELPAAVAVVERAMGQRPLAMHCIGMSLCSAEVFDLPYVDQLAAWQRRFGCAWASEHLSFTRVGTGHEVNASMALPVPYDEEVLELLVPRVLEVQARLGCPFLKPGLGSVLLALGLTPWGWLLVVAVIALQTLLAATGFCLGCRLFFVRWLVPDLFARAIGRGTPREALVRVPRR